MNGEVHVSVTQREADGYDRTREVSYLLIGTPAHVAAQVARMVEHAAHYGRGPFTVTPIHPAMVVPVDADGRRS